MREFVYTHFEHVLFCLLLLSRMGDVLSTYLATPNLKLEANPVVRRLRWPFAGATILISFIAYLNTFLAVVALVPFLLITASNFSKVWLACALGEEAYLDLLLTGARRSKLRHAIAGVLASSGFIALAGTLLVVLSPDATRDWGFPFGLGILLYSMIYSLYGSVFCVRIFRQARATANPTTPG